MISSKKEFHNRPGAEWPGLFIKRGFRMNRIDQRLNTAYSFIELAKSKNLTLSYFVISTKRGFNMNRIDQIVSTAYSFIGLAKSKHLTPSYFLMGFSLYYYVRAELMKQYIYEERNSYGYLFGLPIKLTENSKYSLSLCCEEYSQDFDLLFEERRPLQC